MNRLELRIDDWITSGDPDPRRANTSANFLLIINGVHATRRYDGWSRTVSDRARLPLYPLAEWLATNWWRLHAEAPLEAGGSPSVNWRLSHDLPGIGGGFVWPRVRLASDDSYILVSARALRNAPWEPVRYLNDVPPTPIKVCDFDRAIDELILSVLARLNALDISAEPLATLWADLLTERSDHDLTDWRTWEARLGYDPDQAPEELMRQLADLLARAGRPAAYEIAPLLGRGILTTFKAIDSLATAPGIDVTPPIPRSAVPVGDAPWDVGRALARDIRRSLPTPAGPIEDAVLLELLGAPDGSFERLTPTRAPLSLGVRSASQTMATLHFRKRNRAGLRFEAARFIVEHITATHEDLWLPLTDRATARQKLQRAFAAELLMPIDEIHDFMSDDYTTERFEDVGERYGVSALAARSHVANHGYLSLDDVIITA